MNRHRKVPLTLAVTHPLFLWMNLAAKTGEMLVASGQVIGLRVQRMAQAGPTPSARDQREFTRMGSEKVKAIGDSALAVALHAQRAQLEMATRMLTGGQPWRADPAAAAAWWTAALAPFHAASTANARRLTRVKPRTAAARR